MTRTFDVQIQQELVEGLDWPDDENLESDSGLGGNREYVDLRGLTWEDYEATAAYESALVSQLDALKDDDVRSELIEELEHEEYLDAHLVALMGLDPGIASVVVALSAAGCAPFASCNGGAFGGRHHEYYPLVAFFCRPNLAAVLLEAAQEAGVGLVEREGVLVYARSIAGMMAFAAALHRRRDVIRDLHLRLASAEADDDGQLDLFEF